jgi:hypothetical protein
MRIKQQVRNVDKEHSIQGAGRVAEGLDALSSNPSPTKKKRGKCKGKEIDKGMLEQKKVDALCIVAHICNPSYTGSRDWED